MKLRRFPATMKALEEDFNAIHENTELGLADLIYAIANASTDPTKLLISTTAVSFTGTGPWNLVIPDTWFAIDGVLASLVSASSVPVANTGDRTVALYLHIERSNVNADRDFLDLSGGTPAVGVDSFVVERDFAASVELIDPYTGPGDAPAAGTDDVGDPILFATATISGGVMTVDHDPNNYTLAIDVGTAAPHAAQHLQGGLDPIDLATPAQEGLISAEDMAVVRAALTNLTIDAGSPFLVRTISGTNPADPKTVALTIRLYADSLVSVNDSGTYKLGLNFPVGGLAGSSDRPARSDHKHNLSDSPIQVAVRTVTIDDPSNQLGSVIQVQAPENFGLITNVVIHWLAPTITSPYYPLVQVAGIMDLVGVRYTLAGTRDIRLRIGDNGLCNLTAEERALVLAVTGSQTWDSAGSSAGLIPTTGKLVIYITGVRLGLTVS